MKPAVVFVAYRIPEARIAEHWEWNDDLYRAAGATVYVVCEQPYECPDYAVMLPYHRRMAVFNLSATSNYGISRALFDGCDPVVKLDCDTCLTEEAWWRMLAVDEHSAVVPLYLMASSYERRASDYVAAPAATGQVSMTAANWQRLPFDERCEGYGCDDGILLADIRRAGLTVDRSTRLYHIAHRPGTCQTEFHGRSDHWNRDSGFNPENFRENRKLHYQRPQA